MKLRPKSSSTDNFQLKSSFPNSRPQTSGSNTFYIVNHPKQMQQVKQRLKYQLLQQMILSSEKIDRQSNISVNQETIEKQNLVKRQIHQIQASGDAQRQFISLQQSRFMPAYKTIFDEVPSTSDNSTNSIGMPKFAQKLKQSSRNLNLFINNIKHSKLWMQNQNHCCQTVNSNWKEQLVKNQKLTKNLLIKRVDASKFKFFEICGRKDHDRQSLHQTSKITSERQSLYSNNYYLQQYLSLKNPLIKSVDFKQQPFINTSTVDDNAMESLAQEKIANLHHKFPLYFMQMQNQIQNKQVQNKIYSPLSLSSSKGKKTNGQLLNYNAFQLQNIMHTEPSKI